MTLALNITDPLLAGQVGKAAFDAVGPLLLIGWAEVGPGLLQAISSIQSQVHPHPTGFAAGPHLNEPAEPADTEIEPAHDDLLQRARREDTRHRELHQRPISAETLRKQLHIGAAKSRMLVAVIRNAVCPVPGGGSRTTEAPKFRGLGALRRPQRNPSQLRQPYQSKQSPPPPRRWVDVHTTQAGLVVSSPRERRLRP